MPVRLAECLNGRQAWMPRALRQGMQWGSTCSDTSKGHCVQCRHPSYFVGLLLREASLPYNNYGHVVLAKPSPILFYPISSVEVGLLLPHRFRSTWRPLISHHCSLSVVHCSALLCRYCAPPDIVHLLGYVRSCR